MNGEPSDTRTSHDCAPRSAASTVRAVLAASTPARVLRSPGALLAIATLALIGSAPRQAVPTLKHPGLVVEPYVTGLTLPTGFVFTGPDSLLVIEKTTGKIRRVEGGQIVGTAVDLKVNSTNERGGLSLALDPEFDRNGRVYVYYSAAEAGDGTDWVSNTVTRFRFDGRRMSNPMDLLSFRLRPGLRNGPNHNGGPLRFGPDGYLYGLVGDLNRFDLDAIESNTGDDASAEVGGIFRIDTDGSIPPDNPFADHPVVEVRKWFVYGVRNGFGMAFDSTTGRLWFTENGPNVYDEINVAVSGGNSGWTRLMGPDRRDAEYLHNGNRAFDASDLVMLPGASYIDPVFSWLDPIGVTAMAFLHSESLPRRVRGALVVGDVNHGDLYLFQPRGKQRKRLKLKPAVQDRVADTERERRRNVWGSGFNGITDMRIGPDGNLYVLDFRAGTLWRIRRP